MSSDTKIEILKNSNDPFDDIVQEILSEYRDANDLILFNKKMFNVMSGKVPDKGLV